MTAGRFLLFTTLLCWAGSVRAQDAVMTNPDSLLSLEARELHPRGPYSLLLQLGVGPGLYTTPIYIAPGLENRQFTQVGLPVTMRLLWQPDHRLRMGLETGWLPMYNYRATAPDGPVRVQRRAIPILAVIGMRLSSRMMLLGGAGNYYVMSRLNYQGEVNATRFSLGWMAALHYVVPVGTRWRLGGEVKWFDATQTNDALLLVQAQAMYRIRAW